MNNRKVVEIISAIAALFGLTVAFNQGAGYVDMRRQIRRNARSIRRESANLWREGNIWARAVLFILVVVPFMLLGTMLFASTFPSSKEVFLPITAALPFFAVFLLLLAQIGPLWIPIAAFTPGIGPYVRQALTKTIIAAGCELIFAAYLWFVPVDTDPQLILGALLLLGARVCFSFGGPKFVRILIDTGLILITLTWIFGGPDHALAKVKSIGSPSTTAVNYHPLVCPDAWQHDTQEPTVTHFTVKLHESCFDGFVHLPKGWHEYRFQPVGNDPSWWFSIWFQGTNQPAGVFDRNATPNFAYHPAAFRLQGKEGEEILFYTNE